MASCARGSMHSRHQMAVWPSQACLFCRASVSVKTHCSVVSSVSPLLCIIRYGNRSARPGAVQAIISWSYVTGWGRARVLGVSNAGTAACGAVPGVVGVVHVPRGIRTFLHSLTHKIPSCSLFCWAPVSLFHIPSVSPGLSAKHCGFEGSTFVSPSRRPSHATVPSLRCHHCHAAVTALSRHRTLPHLTPTWSTKWAVWHTENTLGRILQGEGGRPCLETAEACVGAALCPGLLSTSPPPPCCQPPSPSRGVFLRPHLSSGAGLFAGLSGWGLRAPAQEWGVQGGQAPAGLPRWGITHLLAHNMSCNFRQTFEVPDICIMCASLLATPTAVWHFQD